MTEAWTSRPLDLGTDEVHVWYAFPERVAGLTSVEHLRAILSDEETARQRRFVFEKDRDLFLVARVLVRVVLSRYAGVAAAAWNFTEDAHGKPEIAGPAEGIGLRFNLSHTGGMATCAVTRNHDVGVDVENVNRRVSMTELARRYFAAREAEAIERLSGAAQRERFFAYWTLKEAYVKARGLGLSIPLDGFAFEFDSRDNARIVFMDAVTDSAADWQFARFQPSRPHRIAVAIRAPSDRPLAISIQEMIPPGGFDTV
ncbi:MAG: 4'-phosphopantetheinyl transferase superfamily protein [Phycisphaerae bacterium]|nr:4'-phosphopantetheinyl transferase superfamily protein [Phycisphaerae bacterium]